MSVQSLTGRRTEVCLTHDAYSRMRSADEEWVGTADYMGLAYFWAYEYRFHMRDATAFQKVSVHVALLEAGLELDGESEAHRQIIEQFVRV